MDYSTKVTAKSGSDQEQETETPADAASPSSSVELSESAHPCPACPTVLSSSRELTTHLRGHNSPRSTDCSGEEDYCCGVCNKVLSSASSLDRHVLVHSGERPFKCKYCDMAFTTNGNMNRHLRTAHRADSPSAQSCTDDSEGGSSDSEKPAKRRHLEEYNNNEVAKRNSPELLGSKSPGSLGKRKCPELLSDGEAGPRKHKILLSNSRSEMKPRAPEDHQHAYNCPVCGRQDFATSALLEAHLERSHPEFPAKCDACNLSFKNHRVLNLHRFMIHFAEHSVGSTARNLRNSVVGFNDLTFVDFSSDKFPAIARAVCEQSLHRPASGELTKFQCSKCLRAFPCRSALEGHETDCGNLSSHRHLEDSPSRRDDFFAGLDLQNKAALTEAKEGKDLADIQSIISVTSGPILQNFPRSDASTPESHIKYNPNIGSSGSSGTFSSEYHEEEAQDAFAAEFRKMKLKGEFPCRLCTAIFPNLRALKGHNRAHMGVGPGMPYPCNMCPYTSTDKATLVRHLRSHNGDRPYECSLCNYAFTTKANCERHVRNRHGKLTREDIKSVLIYHPNEDSTNDSLERSSPRVMKDDVRKSLIYPSDDIQQQTPIHYPPVPMEVRGDLRMIEEAKMHNPSLLAHKLPLSHLDKDFPKGTLELSQRSVEENSQGKSEYSKLDEDQESRSSEGSVSLVSDTKSDSHQRIQASPMNLKKALKTTSAEHSGEEAPLDLSMDVLDLSKKSKEKEEELGSQEQFGKSQKELYNATSQLLLTEALLKAGQGGSQPSSLEALYANAHLLYRNFGTSFAGMGAGILPPYLFNPHVFGQDFSMKERLQKELIRGLQLTSGGTLIEPPLGNSAFTGLPQGREHSTASGEQSEYAKFLASKMANKSMMSREKAEVPPSNSVKMVIKNGVLMPKQKQRRYRTERPFTCEHCSARFTLRSNMERHIKQQHPQHWSQRPRGGHSTRGRPPSSHPTLLQNLGQPSQVSNSYQSILPKLEQSGAPELPKHSISDQVKYAILAQQLKANKVDENDSEEELIIDEEDNEKEASQEHSEHSTSLLRGQLEAGEAKESPVKKEVEESVEMECEEAVDEKLEDLEKSMDEENSENLSGKVLKAESVADKMEEKSEDGTTDLASVSELLDKASQQYHQFQPQYLSDEEGLVASTSDCNNSGSDEKSDSTNSVNSVNTSGSSKKRKKKKKKKKKSAYSMAPNRVNCPYCKRPFPWRSSLNRHILTHTGQKPYQCVHCSLLFTTKSNCDRHLLRKHKTNPNKIRRVRTSSSPESHVAMSNNNIFSMRNVPERPYKCNQCPSSTFSTLGNLKKHRSTKHSHKMKSRPESPASEPQHSPEDCAKQNEQSDYDSQSSSVSENMEQPVADAVKPTSEPSPTLIETPRSRRPSPRSSPGPSDLPFKCHLCDSGFAERQDCLEHIKMNHKRSYEMLVAKGALDMDIDGVEDPQPPPPQHPSDGEEKRGRFPDYSNRKVVCAFCMRRFWSAEDLRRHMRTHTGERPFSCDICCRRFTLKHSMLRHRKKHESIDSTMYVGTSGDEENAPSQPPTITPRSQQQPPALIANGGSSLIQERISLPTVAPVATADAAPSGLMRFNPYEKLATFTGKLANIPPSASHEGNDGADNDLISNLLGIRDKNFIDRVLQASADDAAKLLGIKRCQE